MNHIIKRIAVTALLPFFVTNTEMFTGKIKRETKLSYGIKKTNLCYAVESMDYINGGITFDYPANFFSTTPKAYIMLELKGIYSPSVLFIPCITSNSTAQTTIRVNKDTSTTIEEAATDDVTVHLFAIGE